MEEQNNEKEKPPCYYELLGVEKDATQDQIRKAYLRASLKFHPDKNPGDEAAEEMFKLISEAYSVLQDETKRELYDKYGHEAAKSNIDPEELFEQMFGTRDPKEAFKKVMSDPELRGPVISGVGLATTVGSVYAIYNGIKNKKGMSAVGHSVGGLVGTAAGLTVTLGGLATWGVDAAITASKKGIKRISEKVDEGLDRRKRVEGESPSAQTTTDNKQPTASTSSASGNSTTTGSSAPAPAPGTSTGSSDGKSQPKETQNADWMKLFSNYMGSPTNVGSNSSSASKATPMPMPESSRASNVTNNERNYNHDNASSKTKISEPSNNFSGQGPIPMPVPPSQQNLGHPFGNNGPGVNNQKSTQRKDGYDNIYPEL